MILDLQFFLDIELPYRLLETDIPQMPLGHLPE